MFVSGQQPEFFSKKSWLVLKEFFSCLSSYNLMLNMISARFFFYFIVFYFYLNYATCINFFSLLHKCNYNNAHIISCNIPGHLLRHYTYLYEDYRVAPAEIIYNKIADFQI